MRSLTAMDGRDWIAATMKQPPPKASIEYVDSCEAYRSGVGHTRSPSQRAHATPETCIIEPAARNFIEMILLAGVRENERDILGRLPCLTVKIHSRPVSLKGL